MSTEANAKPVPKSLHTVTVILQVARLRIQQDPDLLPTDAIRLATVTLGLAEREDPYGLAAAALKQLIAGA